MNEALYARWLAARPESVQKLAREFPLHAPVALEGKNLWVIGWNESDMLILSPIRLDEDYDEAERQRVYLCADHLRSAGGRPY